MSALTVFKPGEQEPEKAKKVSAADLLAGATKKGKSSNHLVYVGEVGCEAAARWLDLNEELAETGAGDLMDHGAGRAVELHAVGCVELPR